MDKKKKKGKSGKKSKKVKEPEMSGCEAILIYKVNVTEEKLRDFRLQVQAWEEKNERHLARNNKLKSEQKILMERLLDQSRTAEKTWDDEEVVEKTAVLDTLKEKWICTEKKENEIEELQNQLAEVEQEIEALKKDVAYWTLYREKDHLCHANYIEVLKRQLTDMDTCFSYLNGFLTENLAKDKNTIHQDMTTKLDDHKIEATELAISQMPKQYKQEMQDNDWLKQEVAHQQKEFEKLYKQASELELLNLQTMEQLYEGKTKDLKIVRNIFLNQCSEFDDLQTDPGILEMDLEKLSENQPQSPARLQSPDDTDDINGGVFLTQEDSMDFLNLGPIEWKLLSVCGKPAPLHEPEKKSQQELCALMRFPADWPVTKPMLQCLKSVPK